MRFTRYGEPSDKEIDALRQPPYCPVCGDNVPEYGDTCEEHDMTTTEHLQLIKAKCFHLLSVHEAERKSKEQYLSSFGSTVEIKPSYDEAGWRSTIAAIDDCLNVDQSLPVEVQKITTEMMINANGLMVEHILAAWPIELLQ